jgi:ABC-type lipoprotein export system ATPase subunit
MEIRNIPSFLVTFADGAAAFEFPGMDVATGAIYWISGPNGSGKTTLIQNLRAKLGKRQDTFFLDQNYQRFLYEYHTVWWNIGVPLLAQQAKPAEVHNNATILLKKFGVLVDPARYVSSLSGGEQHLVLILRMLLTKPNTVFLDEPGAALDTEKVSILWRVIFELSQEGTTIFVVSHEIPPFEFEDKVIQFLGVEKTSIRITKMLEML